VGEGTTDTNGSRGVAEHAGHKGTPDEKALWEQLKTVFDPEIPVNIVDLGLVYSLTVKPMEGQDDKHSVKVAMTLTAPGCGMGPVIAEDARNRLLAVPGANEAIVEIVWDPPWTQTMISEDGKMQLGLI
jgi:metal-sulfur cluster biosynthetic enzyme